MQGAMEWGLFSAICGIVGAAIIGTAGLAWTFRGMIAARDLDIQLILKDVRHTKGNIQHYSEIFTEMHDDIIKLEAEVQRLAKIVNGGWKK